MTDYAELIANLREAADAIEALTQEKAKLKAERDAIRDALVAGGTYCDQECAAGANMKNTETSKMMTRDELIDILSRYFTIGDSDEYSLVRDKSAFAIGTMSLDDFVEFDDEKVADIADYILDNAQEVCNGTEC